MIWLLNKNILSKNTFVSMSEEKLEILKRKVNELSEDDLVSSSIVITNDNVLNFSEQEYMTQYLPTEISRCQYLKKVYRYKYYGCKQIIDSVEDENINIDLSKIIDPLDFSYSALTKISGESDTFLKSYLTQKINPEFYVFMHDVLSSFRIEEIEQYDIETIETIKRLSANIIKTDCDYYLNQGPVASMNSKVIKLARSLSLK